MADKEQRDDHGDEDERGFYTRRNVVTVSYIAIACLLMFVFGAMSYRNAALRKLESNDVTAESPEYQQGYQDAIERIRHPRDFD